MTSTPSTRSERLLSLDVFRGLTMAFMVLVGNPGNAAAIYTQLDHAPWHGWTITDIVFPSFLWIVGVSITLSVGGRVACGISKKTIILQALKRSLILYGIGLFIYAIPTFDLATLRLLGVLQRIAICYFASTLIYLACGVRSRAAWLVGLLAAYWIALRFIPVPGFGAGNFTIDGNLAHYVDRVVLGRHNYAGTGTWDPEGILSTIPALATTLFGVLGGSWIQRRDRSIRERCVWMLAAGSVLIGLGLLCSHWMPINKKLWTDSFCLFMAGIDFVAFAILFWFLDGLQLRRGMTIPLAFGKNALAVYVVSETVSALLYSISAKGHSLHDRIFHTMFEGIPSPKADSLLYAVAFLAAITLFAYLLYRRKWFVKI